MDTQRKIAVIGGDARQVAAADFLTRAGCYVATWGLCDIPQSASVYATPEEAFEGSRILILPIPLSKDRLQVTGTELSLLTLLSMIQKGVKILCGRPEEAFVKQVLERGAQVCDYSQDEVFMLRNAQPTAEGAVAIAMNELRRTLFESYALVVGYGRIGKLLADLLLKMGVNVTVAARKPTDLAVARLHGCDTLQILPIQDTYLLSTPKQPIHVIFNTVPVKLIGEDILKTLAKDTLLIDLASAPGGVDYDAAHKRGLKTVVALSLPGKVAPVTAGEIIGEYVLTHIKEDDI